MNKSNHYKSFVIAIIVLLITSSITVLNVKAQSLPTLKIHIESPTNKTYTENTILLNISFYTEPQDQKEYQISYWLTYGNISYPTLLYQGVIGQSQPIWESMQLTELQDGNYSLRVSGEYVDGRWWIYAYDTPEINFTVNTQSPTPTTDPTPTPLPPIRFYNPYLILFGSTLLLIALGILAYFKKYRK